MEKLLVKTNAGTFLLEGTSQGLSGVHFPGQFRKPNRLSRRSLPALRNAGKALQRYFLDPGTSLNRIKIDSNSLTPFQRKVYRTLRLAGRRLISYSELARKSGFKDAGRAVGSAMKKNSVPIFVPCHRVVPSYGPNTYQFLRSRNWGRPNCHSGRKMKSLDGGLGEYSAGKKWKRLLLEHERTALAQRLLSL